MSFKNSKLELKNQLNQLGIKTIGNFVRSKDIIKFLSKADVTLLKSFKVTENDEWEAYKLPCAEDEVKGIPTYDAFQIFCDNTTWVRTDDFWEQLKQANMIIYFFISKTKSKNDPLWKVATDQRENTYLDARDQQVHAVEELKLPALKVVAPRSSDDQCKCDLYEMMREGCKCGAMDYERAQKQKQLPSATSSLKKRSQLTADLRKLGIKTYTKKSTGGFFVKRDEVKNVLAKIQSKV